MEWKGKFSKKKKPSEASKLVTKRGLPLPKKVNCWQCKKKILINWVATSRGYSKKHNWEYWTNPESWEPDFWKDEKAREKDKQICGACLVELYYDKKRYWDTIKDLRRRNKLRVYIFTGTIE